MYNQLKSDGAIEGIVTGEENVLPIESIKDETVTVKKKTDTSAKNKPALEEKGLCVQSLQVCEVTIILSRFL